MRTYKGLPEPEPYGEMTKDERNDYAKAKADAVKELESDKAREAREGVPQQWTRPTSTAKPETP